MRIVALILLAAGIAILADHLMHRMALERIAGQMDENPGLAAEQMLEASSRSDCPATDGPEIQTAAQALFTVETAATSNTEYLLEWTIAWLSGAMGLSAPDLSYGPGQIRPSTLLGILAATEWRRTERDALQQAARQPLRLFDKCHALSLAALIIRGKYDVPISKDSLIPRSQLEQIARDWNGQQDLDNADALIAGLRYQRLVYEIFQRLRFGRLHK